MHKRITKVKAQLLFKRLFIGKNWEEEDEDNSSGRTNARSPTIGSLPINKATTIPEIEVD